jgi:hypothetical protein
MSLTRKALAAMGIEADKIDQIMEMHTEVTDRIKAELDTEKANARKYKGDADRLADVEKELSELKDKAGQPDAYKDKYEKLKSDFDKYKGEITAKETKEAKTKAYRDLLKEIGVSEKRLDAVLRIADLDSFEIEDGKIKDVDELKKKATDEWSDYIVSETTKGAKTATPPANVGGNKMTKEQIMNIKDAETRQRAILENREAFGF